MRSFNHVQRVVVKAGTSILTASDGAFANAQLSKLGRQVVELVSKRKKVALVSSGAIGLGMDVLGLKKRPKHMTQLQACASIGQGKLIHAYEKFFAKHGLHTGQMLLTRDGLENRGRFLKARQTFEALLDLGVLPIVNENDSVATEEIAFGDNDILSVQVAHLMHADLLIMLTDVDGFYLKDGSRVRQVGSEQEIDQELVKHLKGKQMEKSVGGMKAKLSAARLAMRLGVPLLLLDGHQKNVLLKALDGEDVGTFFSPDKTRKSARKKWIAFSAARHGSVVVDKGAYAALKGAKKSLLASGIVKTKGNFGSKDVVELETESGVVFGRGITLYGSRDLTQIIGKKSHEIKSIIGYKKKDEVIHRDDLVIWG